MDLFAETDGEWNQDLFASLLTDFNTGKLPLDDDLIEHQEQPSSQENRVSESNTSVERELKSHALFKAGYCARHTEAVHSYHTFKFLSPFIREELERLSFIYNDNWPRIISSELCDTDEAEVKRVKKRKHVETPAGCSVQERPVFACGEFDLSDHHPVVRGCRRCYLTGHICPLITGERWPCSICEKDGLSCTLLREPARKSACKMCKEMESECTFTSDPTFRGPCSSCLLVGDVCDFGPENGTTRDGVSLVELYPVVLAQELENRKVKSCDFCRQTSRTCSQPRRPTLGKCFACHEANVACTFTKDTSNKPLSKGRPIHTKIKVKEQEAAGVLRTIKTRLVHPVILDCDLKKSEGDMAAGCDICQRLSEVLVGRGVACPVVIDFPDQVKLIESGGGHASQGYKSTQLCSNCVKQRRTMIACRNHHFARIASQDPAQYSMEEVEQWCKSGNANSAPFPWCSICPNAAFFSCVASAQNNGLRAGCGITLCPPCLLGYRFFGSDMQAFIKDKMNQVSMDPLRANKARVDLELLEFGGLLSRKKK